MRKPSAAIVLAVLLALSWIGFLASSPFAQEAEPAVQTWEYWMVLVHQAAVRSDQVKASEGLTKLGADGWELHTSAPVGSDSVLHTFRRPK